MQKIIIAFDIDGTLRDNTDEYPVGDMKKHINWNKRICELAVTLSKFKNITCIIWSGGGKDYAERVMHEFNNYFGRTFKLAHSKLEPIHPDIAIDDIQACELGKLNLIVREK